jgi:hypothetical protein
MTVLPRFEIKVNGKEAVWGDGTDDLWDDIVPILNHFSENAQAGDILTILCRPSDEVRV